MLAQRWFQGWTLAWAWALAFGFGFGDGVGIGIAGLEPAAYGQQAGIGMGAGPRLKGPSGLESRFIPPQPVLPPDEDRDVFIGTRHVDDHSGPLEHRMYAVTKGGIYGQKYFTGCTNCNAPYFVGNPGVNSITEDCKPSHPLVRFPNTFKHPFKPVSYYYAGGCWVPVYDTNPWAIGPGYFPYPYQQNHHNGG